MRVPDTPYATRAPTRPGTLLLDRNEGTGRDPDPDLVSRYPNSAPLEAVLARHVGVPAHEILVTAGADDAIDRTCRAFLREGTTLLSHRPTFEMLGRYARLAGASSRSVVWTDGAFPVDALLAHHDETVGLVALVSPNNPTGSIIAPTQLERIAQAVSPTPVLLDLAYIEYAEDDLTPIARRLGNVIVARTMSKAWGLAGCRVGYAVGSPEVITTLRAAGAPYPVSGPSLRIAESAVADETGEVARHVTAVRAHRALLESELAQLGGRVFRSCANFTLVEFGRDAPFLRNGLAALDVLVRDFTGIEELDGALRISVPARPADLETLFQALRTVRHPEALLFDLDGVLVDVSDSYRQCIRDTAAAFGVEVSTSDIAEAKAGGHANNDWDVTRRLVRRAGKNPSLADVTAEFQRRYQGDGTNGLLRHERPLVAPKQIGRLAARYPIAVVTGRPRAEATQALDRFGFTPHVRALVAMEDAPAKPDPTPVIQALAALNAPRAWMFGDTPDDVVAARGAGVLPMGVAFSGSSPDPAVEALRTAGAAHLVFTPDELMECLPQ